MIAEMWYFIHKNKCNLTISKNLLNRLKALEYGDTFFMNIFILIKDLLNFNAPYFEMYRNACFHVSFSYDYFIYSILYLLLLSQFSFSLALVLYLFQFI